MPIVYYRNDPYIAGEPLDSGMQRATANGLIGVTEETCFQPGASIGGPTEEDFHASFLPGCGGGQSITNMPSQYLVEIAYHDRLSNNAYMSFVPFELNPARSGALSSGYSGENQSGLIYINGDFIGEGLQEYADPLHWIDPAYRSGFDQSEYAFMFELLASNLDNLIVTGGNVPGTDLDPFTQWGEWLPYNSTVMGLGLALDIENLPVGDQSSLQYRVSIKHIPTDEVVEVTTVDWILYEGGNPSVEGVTVYDLYLNGDPNSALGQGSPTGIQGLEGDPPQFQDLYNFFTGDPWASNTSPVPDFIVYPVAYVGVQVGWGVVSLTHHVRSWGQNVTAVSVALSGADAALYTVTGTSFSGQFGYVSFDADLSETVFDIREGIFTITVTLEDNSQEVVVVNMYMQGVGV